MKATLLAARMIARRRRMMLRSAIPIGFAAFAFVLSATVLTAVAQELLELERTGLSGELGVRRAAGADEIEPAGVEGMPPELLVSHAWVTPAIVSGPWGTRIAEVWFTDIDEELAFRGLQPHLPASGNAKWSGALINTGGIATADDSETGRSVFALTITIPGMGTISTTVLENANLAESRMVIMVPWSKTPWNTIPGTNAGGRDSPGGFTAIGTEVIRIRGVQPLDAGELVRWTAETGLEPTGWASRARHRMRDLWWLFAALAGLLYLAGGAASAPSVGIVVRRYAAEFQLLTATGYSDGYVRRLVAAIGAIGAAITAAVGSVVAAIVLSIASLRGGIDPSFLPLYWLEQNPVLGMLAPGPPVVPAIGAIVVAAGVGAISALPASRVVATMKIHRNLWG